jgi:hypothetical protein
MGKKISDFKLKFSETFSGRGIGLLQECPLEFDMVPKDGKQLLNLEGQVLELSQRDSIIAGKQYLYVRPASKSEEINKVYMPEDYSGPWRWTGGCKDGNNYSTPDSKYIFGVSFEHE